MDDQYLVVVTLPPPLRAFVGEVQIARLSGAHPRARVEVVADQAGLDALLPVADAVLLWPGLRLAPEVLAPGGRLRWVHSMPAGIDWLLTPALRAADHVAVTASKGPMGPLMAEHAALLLLALARDLPGHLQDQAARRWGGADGDRRMLQLFGKTIAILGVGAVGGNLARICRVGFGMRVLGLARTRTDSPHVDRYFAREALHAALAEADYVALCLSLTPETARIIDAAALAALKPAVYLVNVARGGLVDEDALVAALRAGRLAGAGLDATTVEPLPDESPLWTLPNVIITPHVSPARDRLNEYLADFWIENIRRFGAGEPLLGAVDRQSGY